MKKAISVSQLNLYIKNLLGSDENLSNILVRGEISNFKKHFSGHMYFTLKDNKAAVKCVMFSSYAGRLAFNPTDGMQVTVAGYVSVYEKSGQYQLYAADMIEEGEGALYLEFEKLKKRLLEEGLFDESKKKAIPMLPDSIGVVTSATGSVIKDIINVLDRRFPKYHLIIYPSNVQGAGAELEIAAGIRYFNEIRQTDVSFIAPINNEFSAFGRWNYSLEHDRDIEAIAGISYDSCCWSVQLMAQRSLKYINNIEEYDNAFMVQLVLKGLGSVSGNKVSNTLEHAILGYNED